MLIAKIIKEVICKMHHFAGTSLVHTIIRMNIWKCAAYSTRGSACGALWKFEVMLSQWRHHASGETGRTRLVEIDVLKFAGRHARGREHFASAGHLTRKRRAKEGEWLLCCGNPLSHETFARDQLQWSRNHANTFYRKLRSRYSPLAVPHFLFVLT